LISICRLLSIGDTRKADRFVFVATNLHLGIAFGAFFLFPAHKALNPDMEGILSRRRVSRGTFNRAKPTVKSFGAD
jgi:hypothetical protein